jgi:hypothetical protein
LRIALHIDALDAAAIDEVVDVIAAPGGRQRGVHIRLREAKRADLGLILFHLQRRIVVQAAQSHRREQWILLRRLQQPFARFHELRARHARAVEQLHGETARLPQPAHGRRAERVEADVAERGQALGGAFGYRVGAILGSLALVPRLERQEAAARILTRALLAGPDHRRRWC